MAKSSSQAAPQQNNLSKRIFTEVALLDFCRMANVSEADIDRLYTQIEKLNDSAFSDEKAMDTVIKYDLESINSRDALKERLQQIKSQIADRIFEYYKISENPENAALLTSTLASLGTNKAEAKTLAQAICNKQLHQPFKKNQTTADRLVNVLFSNRKKLQVKLQEDFKIYKDMRITNPIIDDIRSDIIEYTGGVSREQVFRYTVRKDQKEFRARRRQTFEREGGVRKNFVKLIGLMANNGMERLKNKSQTSNYDKFQQTMKSVYGNTFLSEIDKSLGITATDKPEEELNSMRKEAYDKKSNEIYVKMVAGILSNKHKFDQQVYGNEKINYMDYIDTVEKHFIKKLESGIVNVRSLCFEEPDSTYFAGSSKEEFELYKQSLDDTAEKQIASIHHKLPIGAAYDVHDRLFGKNQSTKEQTSDELVNNLGNLCFVLGKDMHQRLEARGKYVLTANADNSVFASEFNSKITELDMPDYLKNEITKLNKSDKVLNVNMGFSDFNYMESIRQILRPEQAYVPIEQKYSRYFK